MSVLLVTVCTHSTHPFLDDWERSAAAFGYETRVLGRGVAWKGCKQG